MPSASETRSPADLTITPRDATYGQQPIGPRWWLGGDPVATAFYNAFSATFPQGERFFMDSVRRYRDQVSEPLKGQINAFITQEALHTREHAAFNRQVAEHGYDDATIQDRTKRMLDEARERPPIAQLGATVSLEHFTAIFAHELLSNPSHLDGAPEATRNLWRWHAIEEIEHKAVAFDTFMVATAHLSPFRRWRLRCLLMVLTTIRFVRALSADMADLMRQDGLEPKREWRRLLKFTMVNPGMVRRGIPGYLAFFRPGFHPWSQDDRALIRNAELALA
jgi:uncharacterized protein